MNTVNGFDVIVVGGGLAGLSSAILLAEKGIKVAVFEKKKYPSHKVCGEYLSKEVEPFLQYLGIDPVEHGARSISQLELGTSNGKLLKSKLSLGAWGLSRYELDNILYQKAVQAGVTLFENEPVRQIHKDGEQWIIRSTNDYYFSRVVLCAHGKRDVLDKNLVRTFLRDRTGFMAVKYHMHSVFPKNTIGLYTFKDGYAGINSVENGVTCFCYLMKRSNMISFSSISEMEKVILYANPFLKHFIESSQPVYSAPLVINEVSFSFKELYKDGIFYTGDSAAMIAPVCGNGMAMALTNSILLSEILERVLNSSAIEEKKIAENYTSEWHSKFRTRMLTGKAIQSLFLNERLLDFSIPVLNSIPFATQALVRLTHGSAPSAVH